MRDYLLSQYGLDIADSVLRYYRENKIDPVLILPASVLKTALKSVNLRIDVLGDLAAVLRKQEERLDTELGIETTIKKLLPTTVKELEFYWRALREYAELLQSIGQLPRMPQEFRFPDGVPVSVGPGPSLQDLMREAQGEGPDGRAPDESE